MSSASQPTGNPISESTEELSLRERVREATREIESKIILETLEKHRWNRRRTAEALRISYRLLMYKMKSSKAQSASAWGAAKDKMEA